MMTMTMKIIMTIIYDDLRHRSIVIYLPIVDPDKNSRSKGLENLLSDKVANGRSLRVNPSEKLIRNPASRKCMICSPPICGPRGFLRFQHRPHL